MIHVSVKAAAVGTGRDAALPPINTVFSSGSVTLLETEGGTRPTVVSLVASGRMKLDAGTVSAVDGDGHRLTARRLRRAIALVDTPLVAEHPDEVSIANVVKEELALARSRRRADRPRDYGDPHDFGSLATVDRLRLLIDLTLRRPDVEALVITSPERHGGDPELWWTLLREVAAGADAAPADAAGGPALLVVTDHATVAYLSRLPHPEAASADALPLFSLPISSSESRRS